MGIMGIDMKKGQVRIPHGILLAGGESRRMMRDKALLEIEGRTLLLRQSELLSQVCDKIWISRQSPEAQDRESQNRSFARVNTWVKDEVPGRGPLEGIRSCLLAIEKAASASDACSDPQAVLVLPVDMPFMTKSVLSKLLEVSPTDSTEVAHYIDFEMPLVLLNIRASLTLLEDLLQSPDRKKWSIQEFLRRSQVLSLPSEGGDEDFSRAMVNTNNPGEWHAALFATNHSI